MSSLSDRSDDMLSDSSSDAFERDPDYILEEIDFKELDIINEEDWSKPKEHLSEHGFDTYKLEEVKKITMHKVVKINLATQQSDDSSLKREDDEASAEKTLNLNFNDESAVK